MENEMEKMENEIHQNLKKIANLLPETELLAMLAEECMELAHAALKLRRAIDGANPTPDSIGLCHAKVIEETADVVLSNALVNGYWDDGDWDVYSQFMKMKSDRWLSRLEEKQQGDNPNA